LRQAWSEQPWAETANDQLATGAGARFPVTARDLMPAYQGAALGAHLAALEGRWIASSFTLDKAALLSGNS